MPDKKKKHDAEAEVETAETQTAGDAQAKDAGKKDKKKPAGGDAKIAALEEQLAEAQKAQAETKDSLLRTAAEYENFRKRSQKEHEGAFSHGVSHAVLELLPIVDVLEAAANAPTSDEEYKKGVLMTLAKCEEVFKKLGVVEIDANGQPFDPELHNACMQEACDGVESGCITRVVQKGYTLGERVIRHAMVAVAP